MEADQKAFDDLMASGLPDLIKVEPAETYESECINDEEFAFLDKFFTNSETNGQNIIGNGAGAQEAAESIDILEAAWEEIFPDFKDIDANL